MMLYSIGRLVFFVLFFEIRIRKENSVILDVLLVRLANLQFFVEQLKI